MNASAAGVAFSAAMIRSPSFSRPASSTTTIISPRAMAASASSIRERLIVGLLHSLGIEAGDRELTEQGEAPELVQLVVEGVVQRVGTQVAPEAIEGRLGRGGSRARHLEHAVC